MGCGGEDRERSDGVGQKKAEGAEWPYGPTRHNKLKLWIEPIPFPMRLHSAFQTKMEIDGLQCREEAFAAL